MNSHPFFMLLGREEQLFHRAGEGESTTGKGTQRMKL